MGRALDFVKGLRTDYPIGMVEINDSRMILLGRVKVKRTTKKGDYDEERTH